jgi:hypothetical protein
MANKSWVTLDVTGIDGVTITGVTINYAVGSIPTAVIDFVPGGPGQIDVSKAPAAVLADVESKKRDDITIDLKVRSYASSGGGYTRKTKFEGLLDGMNVSNSVGQNRYQAVAKGKAQVLRELTKITPGLYPTSINIYKNPGYSGNTSAQKGDNQAHNALNGMLFRLAGKGKTPENTDPITFYTDLMKELMEMQENDWEKFIGTEKLVQGGIPLEEVFSSEGYKKGLKTGKKFFEDRDLSAVTGGSMQGQVSRKDIANGIMKHFIEGPDNILDNYLSFLGEMNCSVIFGNSKMIVIPSNSVLKQELSPPGDQESQTEPNKAGPADYNGYVYNDNGFKDIAHVLVLRTGAVGGYSNGSVTKERMIIGQYSNKESKASGVLAVYGNPWMVTFPHTAQPKDAEKIKTSAESGDVLPDGAKGTSGGEKEASQSEEREEEKNKSYEEELKESVKNYAETMYYHAKYFDRQGSINLDFNPQWVPGTGGWLYIKEANTFISFYVTSVTHRVDMAPPNSGTAITTINFCSGRLGSTPSGTSEDKYLGYNIGKEQGAQKAFLQDTESESTSGF